MENTPTTQLVQPSLDLTLCIDAESCARELIRCADEADKCAAMAQGCAEIAIRHAWNAGAVANKAKEILPHGEFTPWLQQNSGGRSLWTMQKWMKMAKTNIDWVLAQNPRGLSDAYKWTGVLPEPEPKDEGSEGAQEKDKLPWSPIKFVTHIDKWTKERALDFIYEVDRANQFARTLRVEFGLSQ